MSTLIESVKKTIGHHVIEVILVLICIMLALASPGFLTINNLLNVLRNVSLQGIITLGMALVIISGEIDLSVGSAAAFSGCFTAWGVAWLVNHGIEVTIAVFISIIAAIGLGFIFGAVVAFFRIIKVPTFISTLAMLTILRGFASLITGGFPITSFPEWFAFIGAGYIFGIPVQAILFIIIFIIMTFIMTKTTFGRAVYAVGGNEEAARLSGINIKLVKIAVMSIIAVLAAVSGIINASQLMSGTPTVAEGWEITAISAVIIGGASLTGGIGNIWGTFIGILFLGIIINGMTLLNIDVYWQQVVQGLLILVAVLINQIQRLKVK